MTAAVSRALDEKRLCRFAWKAKRFDRSLFAWRGSPEEAGLGIPGSAGDGEHPGASARRWCHPEAAFSMRLATVSGCDT